jgi:hypothetical protein
MRKGPITCQCRGLMQQIERFPRYPAVDVVLAYRIIDEHPSRERHPWTASATTVLGICALGRDQSSRAVGPNPVSAVVRIHPGTPRISVRIGASIKNSKIFFQSATVPYCVKFF